MNVKLSILIPSIPERIEYLTRLLKELERQANDKPVEIIVLLENRKRTIGMKCNNLMQIAQGEYVIIVGDDDWVEPTYVQALLNAIDRNPGVDCIVFDVAYYVNGAFAHIIRSGIEYTEEKDAEFFHKPFAQMCHARRIAIKHKFPDISWTEDWAWAWSVAGAGDIVRQVRIPQVLYQYRYFPKPDDWYVKPDPDALIKLSILIPTIPERLEFLSPLLTELTRQASNLPVEFLVFWDNSLRTTGRKRNELVELAQGEYITFLDDDDWVDPHYVQAILEAINRNPGVDCVVFDVALYQSGKFVKIWKYGQEYNWLETDEYDLRHPNHLMCWARRIAVRYKFPHQTRDEDSVWVANGPWKKERIHQERIPAILYHYRWSPPCSRPEIPKAGQVSVKRRGMRNARLISPYTGRIQIR